MFESVIPANNTAHYNGSDPYYVTVSHPSYTTFHRIIRYKACLLSSDQTADLPIVETIVSFFQLCRKQAALIKAYQEDNFTRHLPENSDSFPIRYAENDHINKHFFRCWNRLIPIKFKKIMQLCTGALEFAKQVVGGPTHNV